MGAWDNTAYVRESSIERIAKALDELFAAEGYQRVDKPEPRQPGRRDPMQYAGGADNELWAVALIPGEGWTVVKTAPLELLCERPGGKSRLGALARALGVPAFQVNLYDGDSLVLVEAAAGGETAVSGFSSANDDPTEYQGESLEPDFMEPRFRLLDVTEPLRGLFPAESPIAGAFKTQALLAFGAPWDGDEASAVDNRVQVNILIPHEECGEGTALYYRLNG